MNGRDGGTRPPSAALPGDLSETAQAVAIARASDAVMVEVSDGFCALVGRRRAEILGRTADQLASSTAASTSASPCGSSAGIAVPTELSGPRG